LPLDGVRRFFLQNFLKGDPLSARGELRPSQLNS